MNIRLYEVEAVRPSYHQPLKASKAPQQPSFARPPQNTKEKGKGADKKKM